MAIIALVIIFLTGIILYIDLKTETYEIKAKRINPNRPNDYTMPKFKRKTSRKTKVKRKVKA